MFSKSYCSWNRANKWRGRFRDVSCTAALILLPSLSPYRDFVVKASLNLVFAVTNMIRMSSFQLPQWIIFLIKMSHLVNKIIKKLQM